MRRAVKIAVASVVESLESRCLLSVVPTFSSATSPTGKAPVSIAVGDFNKDNNLDYVSANSKSGTVTVGFGKGNGLFGNQQQIGVGTSPFAVTVADFNKDTNLDFAVALQGSNQIAVYLGNGAGVFTKSALVSAGKLAITQGNDYGTGAKLVTGDFNGDTKLDMAVTNNADNTVSVMLGKGDGTFNARVVTATPKAFALVGLAAGDFNKDGKTDLAVTGYVNLDILIASTGGKFTAGQSFGYQASGDAGNFSDSHDVIAADLNNDGFLDVAFVNGDLDSAVVYKGAAGGTFAFDAAYSVTGYGTVHIDRGPVALTAGDFNKDGFLDLAVANPTFGSRTILTNDGTGHFPQALHSETPFYDENLDQQTVKLSDIARDIVAGDFNNDGKLDLLTADDFANNVTILTNTTGQQTTPVIDTFTIDPSTFPVNTAVKFTVSASETNGTIAKVAVYLDTDGTTGLNPATDFLLSSSNSSAMVLNYGTGNFTPGTYTAYALATDTTGQTAQKSMVITVTPALVVNNFIVDPSTFPVGQLITLAANTTAASVKFYIDTDGTNGINPSTDLFLGTATSSNSFVLLNVDTSNFTPGTYAVHAIATDSAGHTGDQMVTITALKAPVIKSFDAPGDVYVGTTIPLDVVASETGGTISKVTFYQESNGIGDLQVGSDKLLGTGTFTNGVWDLEVPAGLGGQSIFYAVATDANGVDTAPAEAVTTVNDYEPVATNFKATPSSTTIGSSIVLSANGQVYLPGESGDVTITGIKFYRESTGDGRLTTSDAFVGSGTLSNGVWSISTSTAGLSAGTQRYYAVAADSYDNVYNLGAASSTTVTLTTAAPGSPVINSFSIAPSTFTVGTAMQLTANATETNGTIANVKFYIDVDGTTGLNPATDFFLGTATSSTSTFTLTANTSGYTPGTYTVYAYATDSTGTTAQKSAVITANPAAPPAGGTLLAWEVGGQSGGGTQGLTATTVAAGDSNTLGLTRGSGVKYGGATKAFGGTGWAATAAAGVTGSKFVTFGLTVASGFKTSLSSIDFHYRRSSDGPANVLLQYQLNNGAWVTVSDVTNAFPDTTSTGGNASLNVASVAALQNIAAGTSVNFRLTPYGATASTATWYIYNQTGNDLVIKGSSTATP